MTPFIQWDKCNISSSDSQWGSGSHSNVQWNGSVWLLGGYTFPEENPSNDSVAPLWRYVTVICYVIVTGCVCNVLCHCHWLCVVCRYGLDEEALELIEPQELWPSLRYGHSAVVYEVTGVCVRVRVRACVCVCVCVCARTHCGIAIVHRIP